MLEETRYFTLSGKVPNGGVPPGTIFALVASRPFGPNLASNAFSGDSGPPPPYHAPQDSGKVSKRAYSPVVLTYGTESSREHQTYNPTLRPRSPPPEPIYLPTTPASNKPYYEPPGQYLDDHLLAGDGWSYIAPCENTTIHFVSDGVRPCDFPNGYYPKQFRFSKHKAPSLMTVEDLIKGLGAPARDQNGVTEMEELGNARFAAGMSITLGSEDAKKSLVEVGWTQKRSDAAPIWLVVKK